MKEPDQKAQACIIWMHGLGADSSDMAGLASQLRMNELALRHVFIDAPRRPVTLNGGMVMPAWFDLYGMEFTDRVDLQGIEHSETIIRNVMESQMQDGFDMSQLYLAGFSQGGAMALHTALNTAGRLGGIIALSAFLPAAGQNNNMLDRNSPFFIASGLFDPLVLPVWTNQSRDWIQKGGYDQISFHQYPMEHAICVEEIIDLSVWLECQVQKVNV
ncbi:MAG: carboxylesterase [Legionella sp.]|nr:carboxylesterase [Legionella sp.]